MLRDERWKYIAYRGFRPQLFDLEADPHELVDLGASRAHEVVRRQMQDKLLDRLTARRNRVTMSDATVIERTDGARRHGTLIGEW